MPTARIYQLPKNAMQSGKARTHGWMLDFAPDAPQVPDPLTGWAGSGDTRNQLRLTFPTLEAANAHATREGYDTVVVPTPAKKLLLQAYADNFR